MERTNRKNLKRAAAVAAAATMCLSLPGGALIANAAAVPDSGIALPANIAITATDKDFNLTSSGVLECYGKTEVQGGYTAEITVELQRKGSSWSTVKTWSDKGGVNAEVDKTYTATKGYTYRLKLTHKAYNSSGALIETITKYSSEIAY